MGRRIDAGIGEGISPFGRIADEVVEPLFPQLAPDVLARGRSNAGPLSGTMPFARLC
jgi:hypothetical protein